MSKIIDSELMQVFAHFHRERLIDICKYFLYNDEYFLKMTFLDKDGKKIRTLKLRAGDPDEEYNINFLETWFEEARWLTTDIHRIQIQGFNSDEDHEMDLSVLTEELFFKEMLYESSVDAFFYGIDDFINEAVDSEIEEYDIPSRQAVRIRVASDGETLLEESFNNIEKARAWLLDTFSNDKTLDFVYSPSTKPPHHYAVLLPKIDNKKVEEVYINSDDIDDENDYTELLNFKEYEMYYKLF